MTDLSKTIEPKSDQMNADDLISGPRTITITGVKGSGDPQQPISINFEGDNGKPYKPCKSMRRVMVAAWGADGHGYTGRSMTLYCDPKVKFGGIEVGGIRISHMTDLSEPKITMALTASRAKRAAFVVQRLDGAPKTQNSAPDPTEALATAKEHAANGKDAFTTWWNTDEGKSMREILKPHMDEIKAAIPADEPNEDEPPI